ncbi:MAG: ATP synthase F1 subunit epsilon [Planctomycetota bacterium]|nr:MAG: ATP synthase F1 subunit epsilon [Planctomycetota bacterium]
MADHASDATVAADLRVVVVTPEQTVLDVTTDFVALPLYDGELGVAPGHAPMIGRLGYGELRIGHGREGQLFYIDGGFVQVSGNVVSVLANRAIPRERLDQATIEESIRSARVLQAAGDDQIARRDKALAQSRAQLRVARRAR